MDAAGTSRRRNMQHFSTNDIPARDRIAVVHDFIARHVAGRHFKPLSNDVRIEIAAFNLPERVTVGTASYSPIVGQRTRELTADGRDGYLLAINDQDHEFSVDGRPPITVPAGDLVLIHDGVSSEFRLRQTTVRALSLDRSRLARLVPRIDTNAFYHIPATTPGAQLVGGYMQLVHRNEPQDNKARQVVAGQFHDLAALVLDGFVQGGAGWGEGGIRAARLELVKKEILDRLRDPELNIDTVARSQGVTPRYIQRLFKAEGLTFSGFLRDSRLDLAFRLLEDTDPGRNTISAIAYDAGFHDLSNFNRIFRLRYGVTPSEVRAEALRRRGR
jgi:AraC-like DNA-binding protein